MVKQNNPKDSNNNKNLYNKSNRKSLKNEKKKRMCRCIIIQPSFMCFGKKTVVLKNDYDYIETYTQYLLKKEE